MRAASELIAPVSVSPGGSRSSGSSVSGGNLQRPAPPDRSLQPAPTPTPASASPSGTAARRARDALVFHPQVSIPRPGQAGRAAHRTASTPRRRPATSDPSSPSSAFCHVCCPELRLRAAPRLLGAPVAPVAISGALGHASSRGVSFRVFWFAPWSAPDIRGKDGLSPVIAERIAPAIRPTIAPRLASQSGRLGFKRDQRSRGAEVFETRQSAIATR